jgi:nitroreductase
MPNEVQGTDLFEIIRTTRSMRRLKPDPVPNDLIQKILEAGVCAPSGGNMQRWRFLVVRDPKVKETVGWGLGSVASQKAGAHRVTLRAAPVRARPGSTGGPARVASSREPSSPLGAGAASIGQFIH